MGFPWDALSSMDSWLSAVEADNRKVSLAEKVADDRPAAVHDKCSNAEVVEEVSVPGIGPVCELPPAQTRFATPRVVAGESITTDNQECQLKPLAQSAYYPVTFTAEQWAQLQQAFPAGVCDFSKPGVSQQNTVPWRTYQNDGAGGAVVYGAGRGVDVRVEVEIGDLRCEQDEHDGGPAEHENGKAEQPLGVLLAVPALLGPHE